jgi:hypothetical protein
MPAAAPAATRSGPIGLHSLSLALNLPRVWLRNEALAGRIPCLPVRGRLLFSLDAVERALLERAAVATAQEGAADE